MKYTILRPFCFNCAQKTILIVLLLAATSAFASRGEPDTTWIVSRDTVETSATESVPDNLQLSIVHSSASDDNHPEEIDPLEGEENNTDTFWQWINSHINEIASYFVVLGVPLSLIFSLISWKVKQNRKPIANDNENMGFSALEKIGELAQGREIDSLIQFIAEKNKWWRTYGSAMKDVSSEWQLINERIGDLNNQTMDLTDEEQNDAWKAIRDSSNGAKRILKARLRF